jgi:hypothetical protein
MPSHFQLTLSECFPQHRLCSTCCPCFVFHVSHLASERPSLSALYCANPPELHFRKWKVMMEINWYLMLRPHLSTKLPALSAHVSLVEVANLESAFSLHGDRVLIYNGSPESNSVRLFPSFTWYWKKINFLTVQTADCRTWDEALKLKAKDEVT